VAYPTFYGQLKLTQSLFEQLPTSVQQQEEEDKDKEVVRMHHMVNSWSNFGQLWWS
jgi:hypothetical protein